MQESNPSSPALELIPAEQWSPVTLLQRAVHLRERAPSEGGSSSETLASYPRHAVMLSFRAQNGVAELHENFADVFYVLEGQATLLTGGMVTDAVTVGQGEVRGSAVVGGTGLALAPGDVAHVPAGVPHQMLLPANTTLTCLVVKVQERF